MVNWTKEQEAAIHTSGRDILVAAAAGSGKTAVLVERMIQKLLNKEAPVDIDALLVVTFTNAAAQEMRSRIGSALEKALEDDPTSNHLKKQLSLLQSASISTLHSFCLDVIRKYVYLLDIDPGFRIADSMEADLIKQDVMEDLLEEWYGKEGEEQKQFFTVVDRFSNDRSDVDIEDLILDLYTFATQNPAPENWLDGLVAAYAVPDEWKETELPWLAIIKREAENQLKAIKQELELALSIAEASDGPSQYLEAIRLDALMLEEAYHALDSWDELQLVVNKGAFTALSRKKTESDPDKKAKVMQLRNSYKDRWNGMKDNWFKRNLESHVEDMRELAPVVKQLTELVKQFKDRFTEQKREKGLVDFSDLEHYCLEVLTEEDILLADPMPSRAAMELKKQFKELLVDEYQDVNLVQETILTLISDQTGAGNMFMVGDVKQSIYGFRHAEPTLFIEKYNRFLEADNESKRIDLASNFRSREHVLIGANYIFRQIFDETIGDIKYDADAELIYANKTYDDLPYDAPEPELIIIDSDQAGDYQADDGVEQFEDLKKAQLEARAYAQRIKAWLGDETTAPLLVVDKSSGVQRPIQYRDIVILFRSMTWAPIIVDELKKQGIPVYAELSTGYFEAIEVKIMLSFLKIIDNPRQDIPLAAVLRSPIVGLNEEQLAQIRLADEKQSFYEALKQFNRMEISETSEKTGRFLEQLEKFRLSARQGGLSELIWEIFSETGFYDFVGGMPGGRQRQANLRALYDRARGYETTSFRGLFRFLRFIERMEERGDDLGAARALSEQEDVVRIMTIHKSKGLEFPVVILGSMDKQFNLQDLRKKYILHKDLGFATRYIDPIKRVTYPTLFYQAMVQEKLRELLAEEMRVLYVALTRAKEKLVMIGTVSSFSKKREKWETIADHEDWVLPAYFRSEARSYLDWVGPALVRHRDHTLLRTETLCEAVQSEIKNDPSKWAITVIHASELINLEETKEIGNIELAERITDWKQIETNDPEAMQMIEERLSFQYPHKEAALSRAKQSVTEIKRQQEIKDSYSSNQIIQPFKLPIAKRPNFMQKEKAITGAERGTAMHAVMQHIPFTKALTAIEIEAYTEILVEKEMITRVEAEIIDYEAIAEFYETEIGKYMLAQDTFYREVPFSLSLPASDVYANWESETAEQVLIQGVIDCAIPSADGWIILDYKTDAIHEQATEAVKAGLAKRYETQLKLYARAIESIWNEPVKSAYLYFFEQQLLIEISV